MAANFPHIPLERYADDAIVHCRTEKQANMIRTAIANRLSECGLELHPEKTLIIYCQACTRMGPGGFSPKPRTVCSLGLVSQLVPRTMQGRGKRPPDLGSRVGPCGKAAGARRGTFCGTRCAVQGWAAGREGTGVDPALVVGRQPSGRHDAMDVVMAEPVGTPGVQDGVFSDQRSNLAGDACWGLQSTAR